MVEYFSKIKELEDELAKTKYNKKTQHHIGLVKAKIATLREKQSSRSGGGPTEGYSVKKSGDGTLIMVGFPSVGKSSILNVLTNANSEVGSYAFTTLTVIPGMLEYKDAKIQVLDVPGIVQGAASGRGRGKEVIAVMRTADLLMFIIDANQPDQYNILLKEVLEAGLRPNQQKPDVRIVKTAKDGINIASTVKLELEEDTIKDVLKEFKINNANIVIREKINIDQLIDCIEGNKIYLPLIIVANKIDQCINEKKLDNINLDLKLSATQKINIDKLKELIFQRLNFIRIYMKEPGKEADLDIPLIMKSPCTVRNVCEKLHRDFVSNFKFCKVTGPSAKFPGQKLSLRHKLKDKDILELHIS